MKILMLVSPGVFAALVLAGCGGDTSNIPCVLTASLDSPGDAAVNLPTTKQTLLDSGVRTGSLKEVADEAVSDGRCSSSLTPTREEELMPCRRQQALHVQSVHNVAVQSEGNLQTIATSPVPRTASSASGSSDSSKLLQSDPSKLPPPRCLVDKPKPLPPSSKPNAGDIEPVGGIEEPSRPSKPSSPNGPAESSSPPPGGNEEHPASTPQRQPTPPPPPPPLPVVKAELGLGGLPKWFGFQQQGYTGVNRSACGRFALNFCIAVAFPEELYLAEGQEAQPGQPAFLKPFHFHNNESLISIANNKGYPRGPKSNFIYSAFPKNSIFDPHVNGGFDGGAVFKALWELSDDNLTMVNFNFDAPKPIPLKLPTSGIHKERNSLILKKLKEGQLVSQEIKQLVRGEEGYDQERFLFEKRRDHVPYASLFITVDDAPKNQALREQLSWQNTWPNSGYYVMSNRHTSAKCHLPMTRLDFINNPQDVFESDGTFYVVHAGLMNDFLRNPPTLELPLEDPSESEAYIFYTDCRGRQRHAKMFFHMPDGYGMRAGWYEVNSLKPEPKRYHSWNDCRKELETLPPLSSHVLAVKQGKAQQKDRFGRQFPEIKHENMYSPLYDPERNGSINKIQV